MRDDGFTRKTQHMQKYALGFAKNMPGAYKKILTFDFIFR